MMKCKISILFILLSASLAQCYRILLVFPIPIPSHNILGKSLAEGLAIAGHDVTYITPFHDEAVLKRKNFTELYIDGVYEKKKQMDFFKLNQNIQFNSMKHFPTYCENLTIWTLENPKVQSLLKSKEGFDVVIVEEMFTEGLKVLAHHFNVPLITYSTMGHFDLVNTYFGNPSPKSYTGSLFFTHPMNFWQRLLNTLCGMGTPFLLYFFIFPSQNKIVKDFFPGAPLLEEIAYNTSLILINADISTSPAIPFVPSMINVGGHHIKSPKPLPKELENFLADAKNGVIYFSMGSHLSSIDLPKETVQGLLNVFRKLKQKLIWKWEDENLPNKPENVKVGKWFPQQDILAHPNIKLFITHGGLLSTTETIYHGVPVLAIPIIADQKINSAQMVSNGNGLRLEIDEIQNEELLLKTINELLTNPQYSNNAKRRSKIFRDRPIKPMDSAVFWVEYVIRHKGARHLRVGGLDLPWYQYHLLDVFAFILLCLSFFIYLAFLVVRKILRCVRPAKKIKQKEN